VPVRLEIDVGMGRTGVVPGEAAVALAAAIHESPGLELEGVLTHAGHGYAASTPEELARIGMEEGEILVAVAESIRAAGLPCDVVSVGSTPTVGYSAHVGGVTEIRPGNYAFLDGVQVSLGVALLKHVALSVLATVTARPAPDRVILDCGAKTLSVDNAGGRMAGFGQVAGRPDLHLAKLSEEHGILPVPPETELAVGDRVRIVPNHACVCANLHDGYVVVRGGKVTDRWPVAARGRVA
jgi:D-serine deaminase-like pyridoxal phosphate-dependent protein